MRADKTPPEGYLDDATVDVAVIGAGQAGLAVSYLLNEAEIRHVVLERGDVGESWRSQRWGIRESTRPLRWTIPVSRPCRI